MALIVGALVERPARAGVVVTPTLDAPTLAAALHAKGLTITSASIWNGESGQFGTYTGFTTPPITISNGIVLSTGDVSQVGPPADPTLDFPNPDNDMSGLGTTEFDNFGPGRIESFDGSYDVAALRVNFHLATNSQVRFDFIFGSVEYPYWTSEYTDAMLVFLDGLDPTNQVTFDTNHQPVQVGLSFAGLVDTGDKNTAFSDPHGMLPELTTTTPLLTAGDHTLWFEVGDVNDGNLDSAAFIANLRAGTGEEGTDPTVPPTKLNLKMLTSLKGTNVYNLSWTNNDTVYVLERATVLGGGWTDVSAPWSTNGNLVSAKFTNAVSTLFYRLRRN